MCENKFIFQKIQSSAMWKLWKDIEVNKAAGTNKIFGKFLKDGAEMLVCHKLSFAICLLSYLTLKTDVN